MNHMIQKHPFPPLFDKDSRLLILGSFPSVKSRETMFFYGHPQNRFWKVIASIFDEKVPSSIDEKRELILRNHLALWDVIAECEIEGSSDASIKNAKANDLSVILKNAPIQKIIVNGKTAEKAYNKYIEPVTGIKAVVLPSTSPANAAWTLDRLVDVWGSEIKK
ncbi:MAG: DNA-deoxyinosine glycosylase [Lachnospiraceae bacterium]|nr:DNA-deoxyinosine glycosylase [Lachnospiraceae bacterium]MBR4605208.1 DNA-deoxyinosine glycosylase [Lachnospiraceae bacterium]